MFDTAMFFLSFDIDYITLVENTRLNAMYTVVMPRWVLPSNVSQCPATDGNCGLDSRTSWVHTH